MLQGYLTSLAQNPARLNAFFMDPDAEMASAGLDDAECDALRSLDPAKISAAMTGNFAKESTVVVLIVAPQVQ